MLGVGGCEDTKEIKMFFLFGGDKGMVLFGLRRETLRNRKHADSQTCQYVVMPESRCGLKQLRKLNGRGGFQLDSKKLVEIKLIHKG